MGNLPLLPPCGSVISFSAAATAVGDRGRRSGVWYCVRRAGLAVRLAQPLEVLLLGLGPCGGVAKLLGQHVRVSPVPRCLAMSSGSSP